jgi:hypothetical protein
MIYLIIGTILLIVGLLMLIVYISNNWRRWKYIKRRDKKSQ